MGTTGTPGTGGSVPTVVHLRVKVPESVDHPSPSVDWVEELGTGGVAGRAAADADVQQSKVPPPPPPPRHPKCEEMVIPGYDHAAALSFVSTPSRVQPDRLTREQGGAAPAKVVDLLKDFEERNKFNEWPSSTTWKCWWCAHPFPNAPVGIPVKWQDDKYHVIGCFCSLECAVMHNFEDPRLSVDEMLLRYELINRLAADLGLGTGQAVRPAPDRLALADFGGQMSIEEFRAHSSASKLLHVNYPPMSALTLQVEEVNQSDIVNDFKFIPIDHERISNYKKLRRTKPVVDHKNTLDRTMKLKVETNTAQP